MRLFADRVVISTAVASVAGTAVRMRLPWDPQDPVLMLVAAYDPPLYRGLFAAYLAVLFATPYLVTSMILAIAYIFTRSRRAAAAGGSLPPYPHPETRQELFLILGEQHHRTHRVPSPHPRWLIVPARGLFTGIAVIGAVGSGKTSGCLYPYADQLFGFQAHNSNRRIGGLVLEVKGDFCHDLRRMLRVHGREDDYLEVSLDGPLRYNPLHNDVDAYALAHGIATVINATFGKGHEPFWQQAYTNLVKFLILLHRTVDGYVTLFDVYRCAIDPQALAAKIAEGEQRCRVKRVLVASIGAVDSNPALAKSLLSCPREGESVRIDDTTVHRSLLERHGVPYVEVQIGDPCRAERFEAVERWYHGDWLRIDPKLQTSIVEGVSVFLSLFDENTAIKRVFCPPRACYDPQENRDGRYGRPLPPFDRVIDAGQVCALNFPTVANPALARLIGTLMKQDFQRAVLARIPRMTLDPGRHWREIVFLCDEYHAFATAGEEDPSGDDRFFALSRQARCVAIVATQSLSSLKSALPAESWRTLMQTFRTKVFLTLSDDMSARVASDLAGKAERLVPNYNLSESGQDARVSMLTGRSAAHRTTISTSKNYAVQQHPLFETTAFSQLKNAQAIVLAYDGSSPLAPTYCYLKPAHLDRTRTYFEQAAHGEV
jgi:hypothetical protein